jgi:hypothetical protein
MIDEIRKSTVNAYQKLCQRLKIPNWQKEVFMGNAMEILVKLEKRVEELEKANKSLKEELNNKKDKS